MQDLPCPFEKAILSTQCGCENSTRYYVGERERAGCNSGTARANCKFLLETLKENSKFTLKIKNVTNALLPHNKQMRIQIGGLLGLQSLLLPEQENAQKVENIHGLIIKAKENYRSLNDLPYHEVVKSIAAYETRRKASGPHQ